MRDEHIKHMVQRFLGWKLPANFNPDDGISFDPIANKGHQFERRREPTGTNLFDADQAEAMVRYMVDGIDAESPKLAIDRKADNVPWIRDMRTGEWIAQVPRLEHADAILAVMQGRPRRPYRIPGTAWMSDGTFYCGPDAPSASGPYGYCPVAGCHAVGKTREKRLDGNDTCYQGHTYPSREALPTAGSVPFALLGTIAGVTGKQSRDAVDMAR